MRLKPIISLIVTLISVQSYHSVAQEHDPSVAIEFGKGIQFTSPDSSFKLTVNGRIQSLFEGKSDLTNNTNGADFFVRRSRLNFQGTAFSPKFNYRIQIGFAQGDITSANSATQNNLILRDAMLFYKANKWLRVGFGQTKLPGNRQRQISSANLQLVERSISNNNFTLDRDKGVWLYTNFNINKSVLRSTLAISSGEGRIISDPNGKLSYAGRVEYLPFGNFLNNGGYFEGDHERENTPKLSLAGVYSFNDDATRTMGQLGEFLFNSQTADIKYYGVDAFFKYKGLSLESEFYTRRSDKGVITNVNDITQNNNVISGNTFLIQGGCFFTKTNEIAIRYAQITPDNKVASNMNAQKEYVLGFSHYFKKHSLKIQSDATFLENGFNDRLVYRFSAVCSF